MNKNYQLIEQAGYTLKKAWIPAIDNQRRKSICICNCKTDDACSVIFHGIEAEVLESTYRWADCRDLNSLAMHAKPGSEMDKILGKVVDDFPSVSALREAENLAEFLLQYSSPIDSEGRPRL